jgi:hypothetical protein
MMMMMMINWMCNTYAYIHIQLTCEKIICIASMRHGTFPQFRKNSDPPPPYHSDAPASSFDRLDIPINPSLELTIVIHVLVYSTHHCTIGPPMFGCPKIFLVVLGCRTYHFTAKRAT